MATTLWSIVLAAGAGRRLASVTGGVPKQFWNRDGGPTLLEDTLTRSAPLSPPDRTIIVVDQTHRTFVDEAPPLRPFDRFLYQPCDRGTAAGVLLGLMPVIAEDPDAIVMLTPSDHGVADPILFVDEVRRVERTVEDGRAEVVLLGITPEHPEGDYGWIVPCRTPPSAESAPRQVSRFVEKPAPRLARQLVAAGGVWNTMVLVARASALLALYRRHLPMLTEIFMTAPEHNTTARIEHLQGCYAGLPVADFSRDLLGAAKGLMVHTLPGSLGWSDLGTPERLERWRESSSDWARRSPAVAGHLPATC